MTKTIIAGSRTITDINKVFRAIADSDIDVTYIISGGAKGIDELAIDYAMMFNLPYKIIPADWDKYGKAAGYIRNEQMAKEAEACIAVWDGKSPGTKHMIETAKKKNLRTYVHTVRA